MYPSCCICMYVCMYEKLNVCTVYLYNNEYVCMYCMCMYVSSMKPASLRRLLECHRRCRPACKTAVLSSRRRASPRGPGSLALRPPCTRLLHPADTLTHTYIHTCIHKLKVLLARFILSVFNKLLVYTYIHTYIHTYTLKVL